MRRVIVNQPLPISNCAPPDKKSKDEENEAFKGNVGQNNQLSNGVADKVAEVIPLNAPNSSAQFYRTWRELGENSRKYNYLKVGFVSVNEKVNLFKVQVFLQNESIGTSYLLQTYENRSFCLDSIRFEFHKCVQQYYPSYNMGVVDCLLTLNVCFTECSLFNLMMLHFWTSIP